jgi:hypothetical protein
MKANKSRLQPVSSVIYNLREYRDQKVATYTAQRRNYKYKFKT